MSRLVLAAAALGLSALPAAAGCVGQCYRETYVPPSYENVTERVMTRAPRTYALTTPAEYAQVQETVLVQPASRHWSVTTDAWGHRVGCWVTSPARYGSVSRTVMTRAPQVTPYSEPAQYGYRSYSVQTQAGYRAWAPVSSGYGPTYGGGYRSAGFHGGLFGATLGGGLDGEGF